MKRIVNGWAVLVVGITLLASCFDPPVFSPIPAIELDRVVFKDVTDPSTPDSLILSVKFTDGDGNMGLDPTELAPPYNDKFFFRFQDGTFITYKSRRTVPSLDTLPAFVKPFNCINWEVQTTNQKIDTFYFQLNPNHHNIFVRFYIKNNDGTYREFDWRKEFSNYPSCGITFDGRFPILSKDLSQKTPLTGTINYKMPSVGFLPLFSVRTIKLVIWVQDRALQKSNTIETEFTLQSIKQGG